MSKLYTTAIRLLSKREHSADELRQKLLSRCRDDEEITGDDIEQLITQLQQDGLQSDQRYAESYTHVRYSKGYGPQRIDNELRERGVSENIRRACLYGSTEHDWWSLMQRVREKKFGEAMPQDYNERAKQMRFLQYRGFAGEKILELISQ